MKYVPPPHNLPIEPARQVSEQELREAVLDLVRLAVDAYIKSNTENSPD